MNERMLDLAKQAGIKFSSETALSPHEMKFAELIIQECAGIVKDAVDRREPASTYVDKIREHFGIE